MSKAPAWLAPALDYLPQWLGHQMRFTEQPGCVLAVAYQGKVVLEVAFGHSDLVKNEKLTPRHRFRVASHSKTFTAVGLMKLREQGKVKLDDTAGQYVGGLNREIANATIAQLLSHTAGIIRDGLDSPYWTEHAPFLDDARLRTALKRPPIIEASSRFKYSNHGFGLAGLVIEAVTREPYNDWIKREIVDVAGLKETTPDMPIPTKAKLARGHSSKALPGRRVIFPGEQSTRALAAATGFVSTAADLSKFFSQLAPNATTKLLTASSRREMTHPLWRDAYAPQPQSYGLGTISGTLDGWDWFGHSGSFLGYVTRTSVVPAEEIAVSVLTNAGDGLSHVWLDGALQIIKRFREEGPASSKTKDWHGRWWNLFGPTDLVPMGDKILLANPTLANPFLMVSELSVMSRDEACISQSGSFYSFGETVKRHRANDGTVKSIHLASQLAVPEGEMTADLIARYEG